MSSGTCGGCKRMTNSATSDWWLTPDLTPTKCFVAWENGVAVQGCAFSGLTPGAQFLYQETIDKWNINSKKTVEEHMRDMIRGQKNEM
jgi:hypothetical protein